MATLLESQTSSGYGGGGFERAACDFRNDSGGDATLTRIDVKVSAVQAEYTTSSTVRVSLANRQTIWTSSSFTELYHIGDIDATELSTTPTWVTFDGLNYTLTDGAFYSIILTVENVDSSYATQEEIPQIYWDAGTESVLGTDINTHWFYTSIQKIWLLSDDFWTTSSYNWCFRVYTQEEETAPIKAINPIPTDASTGEDFSDLTLTWQDGGGATSYNLVAVSWDGYSGTLASGLTDTTYTFSESSPYIPSEISAALQWRIDSINDTGTTTGDTWSFDPRPAKASSPSPADASTGRSLNLPALSWTGGEVAEDHDVYFGESLQVSGQEEEYWLTSGVIPLSANTEYTWRIDSNNEFGTTTGDEWTFTTYSTEFSPPSPTYWYAGGPFYYRLLPGGDPPPTGVEDTDYEILDDYLPNFIRTNKRLVVFAKNNLYYES